MATIITPPASSDLTVLATAREELGGAAGVTDAQLQRLIGDASAICARICGRIHGFGRMTLRETIILGLGGSRQVIMLENDLAPAIVTLTHNGEAVATADYVLTEAGMLHRASLGACCGWRWYGTLVVEYDAGFALLEDLPPDIERACLLILRNLYFSRGRDASIRQTVTEGVGSVTYATVPAGQASAEADPMQLLAPWRRFGAF